MEDTNLQPQEDNNLRTSQPIRTSYIETLKLEQNLVLGIIGGLIGCVIGAVLWATITYFTERQIGWMAVAIGFLVSLGVRILGRGISKSFGVAGAIIAFLGVVLGNFLAWIGFIAKELDLSYLEMLVNFNYSMVFELFKETFSIVDILFYSLAIYTGYMGSFRRFGRK